VSATVDAGVLAYASDEADPAHARARALIERLAAGPDPVYLFWTALIGYLRIVTHASVLPRPLPPGAALANVSALLSLAHVRAPGEGDGLCEGYRTTAGDHVRGNLASGAHIAALMRQHGVTTIYTRGRDYRRFDGIRAEDPFA